MGVRHGMVKGGAGGGGDYRVSGKNFPMTLEACDSNWVIDILKVLFLPLKYRQLSFI